MERIRIHGVVQGVGFRPFVYRTATEYGLTGTVRNAGEAGVQVLVRGIHSDIEQFVDDLKQNAPAAAEVHTIHRSRIKASPESVSFDRFAIESSTASDSNGTGTLPPDLAICSDCRNDLFSTGRYENYWAVSCAHCGPRFTVVHSLPYDRKRTSMKDFPMCEDCHQAYKSPDNRRFHAQTSSCPECGPSLFWNGTDTTDPVLKAVDSLQEEQIVAIKGTGGTHLACDADSETAVRTLRNRLGRPAKPFAVMIAPETIEELRTVCKKEAEWLRSPRRPIVLVEQPDGIPLDDAVAPNLESIGLFLPYSGLHERLLHHFPRPLVMTSGNLPGQPIQTQNKLIEEELQSVADQFLLHNRRIVCGCDDSVVRSSGGGRVLLRRSRGFVPEPVELPGETPSVLSLGPERGVTLCLAEDELAFLSQHIGNVNNPDTEEYLRSSLEHLKRVTGIRDVDQIVCDLHPDYRTTRLAEQWTDEPVRVQHHHAHIASVMGEHNLDRAVGIAADGMGYGRDGVVRGGEILICEQGEVRRAGGLAPVPMPGGDRATRYPDRMVAAYLFAHPDLTRSDLCKVRDQHLEFPGADNEWNLLLQQLENRVNTPLTSSAGRLLDAASCLLDLCSERHYEGEPAMRLEAAALGSEPVTLPVEIRDTNGTLELDSSVLIGELVRRKNDGVPRDRLAAGVQNALARGLAQIAVRIASDESLQHICFSGGVACNASIANTIRAQVKDAQLYVHLNRNVPCTDGGISYGQAVVTRWRCS
jgi:hydrogenase maturation protein HypF